MKPKIFSITADDELHHHLQRLSEEEHAEVSRVLGPSTRKAEDAISDNLSHAFETGKVEAKDMVNLPPHYARFKIEPIRFAIENGLNFLEGNAVKYVLRAPYKNRKEDYKKAIRCIEMLMKLLDEDPDWWTRATPTSAI